MELIKKALQAEPEKVNRATFLELAKKNEKGVPTSTGVHTVKLLRGEEATNNDYKTQKDVEGVKLFFEEDGIEKVYFVPKYYTDKNSDKYGKFHYLFEKFADIDEGTMLEMEYVKKGLAGYVDVRAVGVGGIEDDIPVIEDDVKVDDIPF